MPIKLVVSPERRWLLSRIIFDLRHVLGTLLFAVAVIIITVVLVFTLLEGANAFPVYGAALAAAVIGFSVVISPSYRTVLFLRKFKDSNARDRQERILRREVFANWRIVSIFDRSATTNPTASSYLTIFLLLWVIFASAALILNYATGDTISSSIRFFAALALAGIINKTVRAQLRRAYSLKAHDEQSVSDAVRRIAKLNKSRWRIINNPVLSVSTSNDQWRSVVQSASAEVDLILMDLSDWGEGILWELEFLAAHRPNKLIVYMQRDAIDTLSHQGSKGNRVAKRIKNALIEQEVLVYDGTKNHSRFRSMLRSAMIFHSRTFKHDY